MKLEDPKLDALYQKAKQEYDRLPSGSRYRPGWRRTMASLVQRDIAQAIKREKAARRLQRREARQEQERMAA